MTLCTVDRGSARKRILLVEDDGATRFMMSEMLEELGVECIEAEDGRRCLERLADEADRIDLVLMDIHMRPMTGLEAIAAIRSSPDDPPRQMRIIAVTADQALHDPELVRARGFNDVIPKPVSFARIRDAVQAL
ncbi:response regulator [Litorisediminicola beolgyonensis]|uniref:Response regulator n=1 Tax=Litorisediminicola beolgyonensis TaxID=1173614 RepID=A0ABW3ZJ89_9RHOB